MRDSRVTTRVWANEARNCCASAQLPTRSKEQYHEIVVNSFFVLFLGVVNNDYHRTKEKLQCYEDRSSHNTHQSNQKIKA